MSVDFVFTKLHQQKTKVNFISHSDILFIEIMSYNISMGAVKEYIV